jgi:exopolysaccharide biosynthesis protein
MDANYGKTQHDVPVACCRLLVTTNCKGAYAFLTGGSLRKQGLTLEQLAEELIVLGANFAINLDGGSSSTMVLNNQTVNYPKCLDIPIRCERRVSTVVCVPRKSQSTRLG